MTGNFFALLGVQPAIGRSFTSRGVPGEVFRSAGPPVEPQLLAEAVCFRPQRGGPEADVEQPAGDVVGVLPAILRFRERLCPRHSDRYLYSVAADGQNKTSGKHDEGHRKAEARRDRAGARRLSSPRWENNLRASIRNGTRSFRSWTPLEQHVSGRVRPALFVLACAVGVVMLIVCANLSNLQLARLGARQKEMAMRAALGAGRSRLLRQMLTESVALSCCGAVLGLILAVAGTRELAHLHAFNLPLLESVRIDGSALAFHVAGGGRSRACSLDCCRHCRFRHSRFVKACKMPAAGRAAASGMPGCATDWWFPNSPSPAYCWSARGC